MRNSKKKEWAEAIIREVLELTDEDYLEGFIDEPVKTILSDFEFDRNAPFSQPHFLYVISDFIQKVYLKGPGIKQDLSQPRACTEALHIIEKAYRNQNVAAYDAALADAVYDISLVLARMSEFIIARNRKMHMDWVYRTRIDHLGWTDRCLIAEILLNQWGPFLPPRIRSCAPAHLADAILQLLDLICSSETFVKKTMISSTDFF
jgi:hypothetical protein